MAQTTDPFYEKFGKRLRRARAHAGLTQEVASGLLGMDQTNLSRLELGKQGITLKDAYRFSDLYKVPFDHLVMAESPLDTED
jgi:Predicted transcriptional regulators